MGTDVQSVLEDEDLNATDRKILAMMEEGRITPPFVSEELDISREYASERLIRLKEHTHVTRISPGLYELVDDPREDAGATGDEIELKRNLEAVKYDNRELRDELDDAHERIEQLEEADRQAAVNLDVVRSDLERAIESREWSAVEDALARLESDGDG